jgi:hypothetical protein
MADQDLDDLASAERPSGGPGGAGMAITVKARSRLVAAAEALLGAAVDLPTESLKALAHGREARAAAVSALFGSGDTDAMRPQAEAASALLADALGERARRVLDRSRIVGLALEALGRQAPPDLSESEQLTRGDGEDADPETLDDAWLNLFASHIDRAGPRLSRVWGAILAGQVRRPGAFSPTTLRAAAELDGPVLAAFERWARLRTREGFIAAPEAAQGELLMERMVLQDAGLISAREPPLRQLYITNQQGVGVIVERTLALLFQTPEPESQVQLPVMLLTRVGRQLAQILPPTDEEQVLLSIAGRLSGEIREIYLVAVNAYGGGKLSYSVIRAL